MIENNTFTYNNAASPIFKFGNGKKTILVLHGWGSSIKSWQSLLESVSDVQFTTYFLELPGFGNSKPPTKPWQVSDYANFISAFVKQIKPNHLYLVVHSFGARIATDILSTNKVKVEKAIYIGAAGIKPKLNLFQKFSKKFSKYFKVIADRPFFRPIFNVLRIIVYKLHRSGDYLKVSGVMKQTFLKVIEKDYSKDLENIEIPVRLIWGENDSYTQLWMGNLMNQQIPNSEIIIIPDGKHGIHLQNPDVVLQNIHDFFTD
jgi:pimeloyl-ACP methyl ester carboxylesterase